MKKNLFILKALLICIWLNLGIYGKIQAQNQAKYELEQMHQLLQHGDNAQAVFWVESWLRKNKGPYSAGLMNQLSDVLRQYSRFEDEKKILSLFLGKMKSNEDALELVYRRMMNFGVLLDYKNAFHLADSVLNDSLSRLHNPNIFRKIEHQNVLFLSDLGLYHKSNDLAYKALEHCEQAADSVTLYSIYTTIGFNLGRLDAYEQAMDLLIKTLNYRLRTHQETHLVYSYLNVADVYSNLNRNDEAERNLNLALYYSEKVNRIDLQVWVLNYLSFVQNEKADLEQSEMNYLKARNLAKQHGLTSDELVITHTRLLSLANKNKWKESGELIKYIDQMNSGNIPEFEVPPLIRFRYEMWEGNLIKAESILQNEVNHPVFKIDSLEKQLLKIQLLSVQKPDSAEQLLTEFLNNYQTDSVFGSDLERTQTAEINVQFIREVGAEVLKRIHNSESLVFLLSETLKASVLQDRIRSRNRKEQLSPEWNRRKKEIEEQIAYEKILGVSISKIDSLKRIETELELQMVTRSLTKVTEKIQLDLESVQNDLSDNMLFINLLEVGSRYAVLTATKKKIKLNWLESKSKTDALIHDFTLSIINPKNTFRNDLAQNLSELLLDAETIQELKSGNLSDIMISAEGRWSQVPFAALKVGPNYWIEMATVRIIPSFSTAKLLLQQETLSFQQREILAIANPKLPENSVWTELPYSQIEGEQIKQIFPNSKVLSKNEAVYSEVNSALTSRQWDYIHWATHGVSDSKPESSRMVLSHPIEESKEAYLFPSSLPENQTPAEMVVLSACESAKGVYYSGEGVWSMQRAWFSAGANSVLAGLWAVNDRSMALFMKTFYDSLAENGKWTNLLWNLITESKTSASYRAKSVREAQIYLLNQKMYAHPFYWAGMVYMGM